MLYMILEFIGYWLVAGLLGQLLFRMLLGKKIHVDLASYFWATVLGFVTLALVLVAIFEHWKTNDRNRGT